MFDICDLRRQQQFSCFYDVLLRELINSHLNPFASEAVYTRNFFSDRMSDSV